jgi:DNA-binding MarR family transcriptional regulator
MDGRVKAARAKRASKGQASAERVDIGHLDHVLGYVLRRAQIAVFKDFRRVFELFDIRPTQYAVLSILADHPGLRQGEVSHALGIKRANFVAVLDELERRGLARRTAMPEDRRSRALHLTKEGAALFAEIQAMNMANEARLAALLPPGQQAVLIDLLRRLTDGLGKCEA